ncbi:uncharacterized protein LOC132614492 [Lycium barbarum]|uniref:uncharacterized protein LOC132614492 n=1 Tax=Lycium barbarum TaxID=112863 RepID=UPI00293F4EF7|nr:uncharacterized protein LOC132614492 [Lycium barbarum]
MKTFLIFVINVVLLGHNVKNCVQRAKDAQLGTLKSDQFGTWLKAESHVLFSEVQRRQGINSTDKHPKARNLSSEMAEGRRVVGIINSLQNLEGAVESKGKNIMVLNEEDDIVLNKEETNQVQSMDLTNYGSCEQEVNSDGNNAEEGTSGGIKTISIKCVDMDLGKEVVRLQLPEGREDAAEL